MAMMIGGLSDVQVGLRAEDEYIVTAVDARTNSGLSAVGSLLQLVGKIREFDGRSSADVSPHTVNMMKIAAREHQHFDAAGTYQPIGMTFSSSLVQTDGSEQVKADWSERHEMPEGPTAVDLGWIAEKDVEGAVYWVTVADLVFRSCACCCRWNWSIG